jgi:hypothetical protein
MPNSKNTFSMQIVRPTKMQAWVFVVGCGLSSMFGAAATAVSQGPPTVNIVMLEKRVDAKVKAASEKHLVCHNMTVHTALPRAEVYNWLSSEHFMDTGEARFVAVAEHGEPGMRIDSIAPRSILNRIGLRSGDTIQSVQGVPVLSPRSTDHILARLVSQAPETMSVSFTRRGCPLNLELFL